MADDRAAPATSWAQGFLGRLAPDDRERVLARMCVRTCAAGAVILASGDSSRESYVLLKGRAVASILLGRRQGRLISRAARRRRLRRNVGP